MNERSRHARARLARAHRFDPDAVPALDAAYRDEAWRSRVEELVDAAPPLSDGTRAHLRSLLAPVIGRVDDDAQAAA
ncbi:MAG: hypothetical protein OJJ54_24955 [Pseudonocardia sp.]|nr:hypothetical protein [Pseudonocardia sp.]